MCLSYFCKILFILFVHFFQTQRKRRLQIPEMEWWGEEEFNSGVPVWRGEPQVRKVISMMETCNDLDIHVDSSQLIFGPWLEYEMGKRRLLFPLMSGN